MENFFGLILMLFVMAPFTTGALFLFAFFMSVRGLIRLICRVRASD